MTRRSRRHRPPPASVGRCAVHEPPEVAPPIPVETPPNKADAAWERLLKLREEARALGIEVDDAWPIQRLIEEIASKS
jgi:hypothetical protein